MSSVENNPLISVIIPTYNRGPLLKETLDSVLAQSCGNYEVIIVDDGSTDETRSLVESYPEYNPLRYIYQENKGVAEARNTGVRNSLGEFVAFCDSDDLWKPHKLEKQMRLFSEGTALVFSDGYLFEDISRPKGKFYEFTIPHTGRVYDHLLANNFIVTSTVVVRKALMLKPFRGRTCEDWQMWLSVAKQGDFAYVPEPLVYYYEHGQGLSKAKAVLYSSRIGVREEELAELQNDASADRRMVRSLRMMILKDRILLRVLDWLPEGIMKRINSLYYGSRGVRKVIKTIIGG